MLKCFDDRLKTRIYDIHTPKVGSPICLAVIADLHSCYYGKKQKVLVNAINRKQPDFVLMCGDIVDDTIPNDNTIILLDQISGSYNCYYVTGNHEYFKKRIPETKKLFRDYGITILEGAYEIASVRDEKITFCGVDDPMSKAFNQQLSYAAIGTTTGNYNVLLTHRPEKMKSYVENNFDLVVAGHAHGGQWRLPFPGMTNGFFAPNQGFFPKYVGGYYKEQDTVMIVSRGLSRETTFAPRIYNPPELVIVNILPKAEDLASNS
jgi:predicted MPP superfamily phosphohydrolase